MGTPTASPAAAPSGTPSVRVSHGVKKLKGKFTGEIERGEKSVSPRSFYKTAAPLGSPAVLADVPKKRRAIRGEDLRARLDPSAARRCSGRIISC